MFKVQELRELIRLVDQSSISEFTYENEGATMTIKKESNTVAPAVAVAEQAAPAPAPVVEAKKEEVVLKEIPKQQAVPTAASEEDDSLVEIVSPMVGTFYRKPSPDQAEYVVEGDQINEDTIVCIVEAMKLFNEIEAEITGEIVEVLVGDGELVEYGQPLFKVKTK
ncbi:MAG TPA: acetyl-CoA carboxylase biotin carboxyl carrier protein [Pseudogracilibacillus sp.]|nr:acetyl-CoA carboxylase biotin carboxyl carrier protein [Pseudogracilibacillus sp.]